MGKLKTQLEKQMSISMETLKAADGLFSLVLKLVQEEIKRGSAEAPATIIEALRRGYGGAPSEAKRKTYPYGYRTEIPLAEVESKGIWPKRLGGPWPGKGDVYFRYNKKLKIAEGFLWNSKSPFPSADRKNIFETPEAALASKRTKVCSPAQRRALEKARAAKRRKKNEQS
jgi:hypothetical protein